MQVCGCVLCVGRWRRGRGIVAGYGRGLLGRARMGVGRMLDRGDGVGRAPTVMEGGLEKVATSLGALLVRGSTRMLKTMDCTLKKSTTLLQKCTKLTISPKSNCYFKNLQIEQGKEHTTSKMCLYILQTSNAC